MNTLMIGYDLNKAGKDYAELIAAIKTMPLWWHHLDSTWLVRTDLSAADLRDKLGSHIDGDDELLVINVTGDAAAWQGFNDAASKWLRSYL